MRIIVDTKDFKKLERDLKAVNARAFPFATKETLNSAAFQAQEVAQKRIRNTLILRNRWTLGSIKFQKTTTLNISKQFTLVGSVADYMVDQEFGGTKRKTGRHGVPIPTALAAKQSEGSRPRLKVARPRLSKYRLLKRGHRPPGQPKNKRQAILFKMQDSAATGRPFFHQSSRMKAGIYKSSKKMSAKKVYYRGWPAGARVQLLFALDDPSVPTPRRPWLKPSVDVVTKRMPAIHVKSLRFQLKRLGLLE